VTRRIPGIIQDLPSVEQELAMSHSARVHRADYERLTWTEA
jgi:hypothetical protein